MHNFVARPIRFIHAVASFLEDAWTRTEFVRWALALPFFAVAWIARFSVSTTRWIVRSAILMCAGLLGFAFIGWMAFAFVRTIFHPLFSQ